MSLVFGVKQFKVLEQSHRAWSQFKEIANAVHEYFDMEHGELVPVAVLCKPCSEVISLTMHAVSKEMSCTRKMWVMLDASAKIASSTSLNDHLLIGRTCTVPIRCKVQV